MSDIIEKQCERIIGLLARAYRTGYAIQGGRPIPRDRDELGLWRQLEKALDDARDEVWWLKERLQRSETQAEHELAALIDRECERRQEVIRLRDPRPSAALVRIDPMRLFSDMQKEEIYRRANGHCVGCGRPLDSDWQADHIVPHSRGGRTEVSNGQALCRPCNGRKSAKVLTVDE